MKTRMGFVSNSSSSSFCIYGAYVEPKDAEDVASGEIYELRDKAEKAGFYTSDGPDYYGDGLYIGRELSTIKDDETGAQFKKDVQDRLEKFLGKKVDCCIYQEGWYDG